MRLVEHPTPAPKGHEVLVRVEACGICHSDLHIWDGYFDLGEGSKLALADIGASLPFTMGHEIVGVVESAGPEATVAPGMRCVVYPWIGCGSCDHCLRGAELDCAAMVSLGTRRAGGYSDHVLVPHSRYILDYGNLPAHLAATCACSGLTAYSALKKLPDCRADDSVLLVGAGGLGLAALGMAKLITPARVVVADIDDAKLAFARQHGAYATLNTSRADAQAALLAIAGKPPRAVIDFVGAAATVGFAMKTVAKGGTIVIVGLFGGSLPVSTALLPMRNLTLRGSYVGTLPEMRELLALMQRHDAAPVQLSSRPMNQINEMLIDLRNGRITGRVVATVDG